MSQVSVRTQPTWSMLLKIFLMGGGVFAVFMALFSTASSDGSYLLSALIKGSVFGAVMALLMGGSHVVSSKRKGFAGPIAPIQAAAVTIPESSTQAVEVIRRSLVRIGARETACSGVEHPVLLARVPVSWRSWGEEMRFECHPNVDASTEIQVSSRPSLRTTVIDWGKGLQNVKRFHNAVRLSEEPSNMPLQRPAGGGG